LSTGFLHIKEILVYDGVNNLEVQEGKMKKYPTAYIEYLAHFHGSRDYFECHEIMEEFWLQNKRDVKWLALIQIAVAVYHERQKNFPGSLRLYRKVLHHLRSNKNLFEGLDIHHGDLEYLIKSRIKNILHDGVYTPMNLPLINEELIEKSIKFTEEQGWEWLSEDSQSKNLLVFKHKLRDRSDVIKAREHSLLKKKKEREEP
jgi:uncharacterized protein